VNKALEHKDYAEFLQSKARTITAESITEFELSNVLFDFQSAIVKWALHKGRAAIFADTGLGKTLMQVEWARVVSARGNVLIVAPLAVAQQTVEIAQEKLDVTIKYVRNGEEVAGKNGQIYITNYEMLEHFWAADFIGVVLDESSILKNQTGKTRNRIIRQFLNTKYKLSCTATPSPNDFMELGSQCEFVGVMTMTEMLAMFFTHDGGETNKWRLKGHGAVRFWEWMAQWALVVRKPHDIGFEKEDSKYDLPPINYKNHVVACENYENDDLFPKLAQSLTEVRAAKRASLGARVEACAALVNSNKRTWIVWCHLNDESDALARVIPGAKQIRGSDSIDYKEQTLNQFTHGELRVLITKPSIAGFGLNWQHCRDVAFVGLDHSFERFYQAIRRVWRFGQTKNVDVHMFTSEQEQQITATLKRKESMHEQMHANMVDSMKEFTMAEMNVTERKPEQYEITQESGEGWTMYNGDCVDILKRTDAESIDYTIFSPPFASLYTYSDSTRDMGNCQDGETFAKHFAFIVGDLLRVTKPGRLLSFHCMNLPISKANDGYIGIRDFRGELIRLFIETGWIYHSEVVIWKDPVTAMQRTKALGLLHKQLKKDACMSRQGIPDYLVTMRKPGENPSRVTNTNETFPVRQWQNYASPIWMDINPSKTLEYRSARENEDERHICPLQLEVIERAIRLWTNQGDLVLSPFAGIGSEGYVALQMGRRFAGIELKTSYYERAIKHLKTARLDQGQLFE
jgi:DNA modification methylase